MHVVQAQSSPGVMKSCTRCFSRGLFAPSGNPPTASAPEVTRGAFSIRRARISMMIFRGERSLPVEFAGQTVEHRLYRVIRYPALIYLSLKVLKSHCLA